MPSPPETRLTIPLRWRDMDMLGHLNQAVYHELLEEARGALLLDLAGRGTQQVHHTYVLARVELDYRHEVRKDHGTVDVTVRVGRVGTKSITLEHEVLLPDGTVAAAGSTVLVGWDMQARGARTLSDEERAVLTGT
ncbi:acyl-CoA thioesterase [Paraconexibacter algicola]|uniref:Acyl-CoA thioesterase n=1 Tax=Paraconexibacter algicola TaxID=2133960 RepID=A0A2T4UEA0_9ACTN|nr:thioesterase family protein [Paraconexibacter algicola]PTL56110.1 acyl-CoA thioesterase [Paraconexibacter algicola]